MRRLLIAFIVAGLALTAMAVTATAASFSVSPWAYACNHTTYGNPATATDPGGSACDHGTTNNVGYCKDEAGAPAEDTPGTSSSSYAAGKLTLSKDGAQCDDLSSGATIGGLTTLTSASLDCLVGACNPGGNLRLNVVDAAGGFYFVSGTQDGTKVTFDVSKLEGKTLKSIDIIADVPGTLVLSNLSFVGNAAPTPTPSATASPSASATATAHPTATPAPAVVLATTGGGPAQSPIPSMLIILAAAVLVVGGILKLSRR